MRRSPRLCIVAALAWVCVLAPAREAAPGEFGDVVPRDARSILAEAFANRYELDLTSRIELVMRNRLGEERRRVFHAAYKIIDGRVHSVGRLVWPHYLRGMTILTIEAPNRSHDAFVFLPSLGRVRRISTAQRGDSFFGSDVTYEDLERRRVEEYEIGGMEATRWRGEPVFVISARSLKDFSHARVVFVVARSDAAILETRYFKRGQDTPYRLISSPRGEMVARDGHVLPTRLTVYNRIRGTSTEVTFDDLRVNPNIDDRLFTVTMLERDRKLVMFSD
ncbi:MAG: outer membrane lipoprotein-sorting protein [Myxococcota bacterium]